MISKKSEKVDRQQELAIQKTDFLDITTNPEVVNISILDTNIKENKNLLDDNHTELQNKSTFKDIFTQISNKYEEVGDVFKSLHRMRSQISPEKKVRIASKNNSYISLNTEQSVCSVSQYAGNSLKINKEICFKIIRKEKTLDFKIDSFSLLITNKSSTVDLKQQAYSTGICQIYNKYFKNRDNLLNTTVNEYKGLKSSTELQVMHERPLRTEPNVKQSVKNRFKMMNYLNTSVYLKSVMNKSSWMKN